MNERIKELMSKAEETITWKEFGGHGYVDITRTEQKVNLEKFAELIVKECLDIADDYDGVGETIVERIKQHFGIEESQGWVCPKCGTDRTKAACPKGHTAALTGDCPMYGVAQ